MFASALTSSVEEDGEPQRTTSQQSKASKHATLQWSFSNAVTEAGNGIKTIASLPPFLKANSKHRHL